MTILKSAAEALADAHAEYEREWHAAYREAHAASISMRHAEYHRENAERINQKVKIWQAANPGSVARNQSVYRASDRGIETHRKWYEANRERLAAYRARRYIETRGPSVVPRETDPVKIAARNKATRAKYRAANRDAEKRRSAAYRAAHLEEVRAKQRAWYAETGADRLRAYREENLEEVRKKDREYHAANRERINANRRARRAAKKKHPGGAALT